MSKKVTVSERSSQVVVDDITFTFQFPRHANSDVVSITFDGDDEFEFPDMQLIRSIPGVEIVDDLSHEYEFEITDADVAKAKKMLEDAKDYAE